MSNFIDKCLFSYYTITMDFKLQEMQTVISIPRIANVHFFEFSKNYETVNDKHPFCELIFVSNGTLYVRSDDYNGILKKKHFIIHLNNHTHSLFCPKSNKTTVIIIGFECLSDKLTYFAEKPIVLNESEVKQLAEIVKEGRNVFAPPYNVPTYDMKKKKKRAYGCEQLLRSLLERFLIGLIRKYEFSENSEETEKACLEIGEIVQYVDNNFLEKTTIDELSFLFHTNRSTLCKTFKSVTGKTLIRYINDKKTELIKEKLTTSQKSISAISEDLNFDCVPYFCAFFKKQTGLSPLEYKKLHAEKPYISFS